MALVDSGVRLQGGLDEDPGQVDWRGEAAEGAASSSSSFVMQVELLPGSEEERVGRPGTYSDAVKPVRRLALIPEPLLHGFYIVAFAQVLLVGASFFVFPMYTSKLLAFGLDKAQIVTLGVVSQAGLGVVQYPLHLLYSGASARMRLERADQLVSALTSGLLIGSLMAIALVLGTGGPSSFPLLVALFLLFGSGSGGTFTHMINVANYSFIHNQQARRVAVALASVGIGIGGCLFTLIYFAALREVPLSSTLFLLGGLHAFLLPVRLSMVLRQRELIAAVPVAPSAVCAEERSGSESDPAPIVASRVLVPARLFDYLGSSVVWLTFAITGFNVGIGASYFSSIGNFFPTPIGSRLTFLLTLAFLIAQVFSRAASAVVYARGNQPWVMVVWQGFTVLGVAAFMFRTSEGTAFVASVCIGLGFGGTWASFPVIAATSFPGDPRVDYSKSLALLMLSISIGSIAFGQIQNRLLQVATWAEINRTVWFTPFLFYFVVSLSCTLAAALLASKISRLPLS